jgi:type I restriction enzyme M protein
VLFIDASREFQDGKNQNYLRVNVEVQKIVETYRIRKPVEKYAYKATREEIAENDYNLNIPRYVDTFEAEEAVDMVKIGKEIADLEVELVKVRADMAGFLKELGL